MIWRKRSPRGVRERRETERNWVCGLNRSHRRQKSKGVELTDTGCHEVETWAGAVTSPAHFVSATACNTAVRFNSSPRRAAIKADIARDASSAGETSKRPWGRCYQAPI